MTVVTRRAPPDEKYAQVNREWSGQTAVVIAGGWSLTQDQVDLCRGARVIAVNDAYLRAPWADVLYFADRKWHVWQETGVDGKGRPALNLSAADVKGRFREFPGLKVSIDTTMPARPPAEVLYLRNAANAGIKGPLSADTGFIHTGSNSAFQALNIATLAGATRVLFIGLDGQPGPGKVHWFGDHPDKSEPPYDVMRSQFGYAALWCKQEGVDVINCSPRSAVGAFPHLSLEEALTGVPAPPAPPAPAPEESAYVRVSKALEEHGIMTEKALRERFPHEDVTRAVRKGMAKGTFVREGDSWRRAPGR